MTLKDILARSYALYGEENMKKINATCAIIFGLGGVGGHCAEALVRAGLKKIYLVDKDVVAPSNLNRQLLASYENIGEDKTRLAKERFSKINPFIELVEMKRFYLPEDPVEVPEDVDIILDCIDTISAKIHLMEVAAVRKLPLLSCMGMGNRFDPGRIRLSKLDKTQNDPLCKVMRKLAKERGLSHITVIYSEEIPQKCNLSDSPNKATPASLPFVPSVAGLHMAAAACNAICADITAFIPKKRQTMQLEEQRRELA